MAGREDLRGIGHARGNAGTRIRRRRWTIPLAATVVAWCAFLPSTAAATVLPEKITENTTLTPEGNPYTGSSTVESGVTLKAEPGVRFQVSSLIVQGTLDADGTAEDPILFTSGAAEPNPGSWKHIKFESGSGESILDHAEVAYGASNELGAVEVHSSSPTITNTTFRKNSAYALRVSGGSPEIAHNTFISNGHYFLGRTTLTFNATPSLPGEANIHDNVIEDSGGWGISVTDSSSEEVNVYDNVVEGSGGPGIAITNSTAVGAGGNVSGNESIDNEGDGLIYSGGAIPSNITDNVLSGNANDWITASGTVAQSTTWNDSISLGETTVAAGVTLTISPGMVVAPSKLTVKGVLKAEGTEEEPIFFTSKAKEPQPGNWNYIKLEPGSSESIIKHVEVSYGGSSEVGAVEINDSSPSITDTVFLENKSSAIKVTHGASPEIAHNVFIENGYYYMGRATISYAASASEPGDVNIHDNLIEGSGGWGINVSKASSGEVGIYDNVVERADGYGIYLSHSSGVGGGANLSGNVLVENSYIALYFTGPAIPTNITDNTLVGNADNRITVSGTVAQSTTWSKGSDAIRFEEVTVAADVTLTIAPGVVLHPGRLIVKGTLNADGTAQEPIVFTSAAKEPQAGQWGHIKFEPGSGESVLDHAEVNYGGGGTETGAVQINASSPTITHSVFLKNKTGAIKVPSGGSPEIAHNTFSENGYYYFGRTTLTYNATSSAPGAVNIHDNLVLDGGGGGISVSNSSSVGAGGTLSGNTLIDNEGTGLSYSGADIPGNITENTLIGNEFNYISITGTVAHSSTWNDGGSRVHVSNEVVVAEGVTLKITEGVYLTRPNFKVKGTLKAEGTSAKPVLFTGPNETSGGEWSKMVFEPSSGESVLDHVEVAYGGWGSGAGMIEIKGGNPRVTNSTIRKSSNFGIKVVESGAPRIERNRFRDNTSGLSYSGTGELSAPNNDWGCASGPKPAGCGDSVSSNVDWKPAVQLAELAGHCRGQQSQCGEGADPVSLATGHLSYSHRDLLLTNESEIPLEFTRAYDSGSSVDAGLGPGWSQTGLASVSELSSGDVLIVRQDGRQDLFEQVEAGYEAPSGVTDTLAQAEGAFQLSTLAGTVQLFDESGRIVSMTDDHGLETTYGYNASGRLATITDPSEQTLTFSYNGSNHITKVEDSTGREIKYTYTGAGDLKTVTDALGGVTEYTYDSEHRITSIKDPRENVILQNTYDGQGRVVEQLDGLENLWKLEYKEDETIVTEPEGGEIVYGFDSQDRVVSETDQLGKTTTTSYNAAGLVDEMVKPGGAKWTYGYDAAGNLTSVVDPEEGERSYEYDGQNRLTDFTDARGHSWSYEWSEVNDLVRVTDPEEGETTLTYDEAGLPLSVADANEHKTEFGYDGRGNVLSVTDPLEHETSFEYDAHNHLVETTLPGALKAEVLGRNALGELTSRTTPEGHTTSYAYNAAGMPTEITDPAENVWKIAYNAMGRPTTYTDPAEQQATVAYDGNLNPTKVTDRRGKETTFVYDLANRLTKVTRPESGIWSYGYDARGNRTSVVDPRENETTYEYDLLDRMTKADEPLEVSSEYGYDAEGNLTSVVDPRGNTTSYEYDELGRPTAIDQPLEKTTGLSYDGVGNLLSRSTAAGTLEYEYDAADRLLEVSSGETTLRSFGYDEANRMAAATDAQGKEIEIGYDEDGKVTSIDDGRGQSLTRSYNSRGYLTKQVDTRGTLEYGYDELGRLISLIDPQENTSTFAYDAEGNVTEVSRPGGIATTNAYDNAGRLAETTTEAAGEPPTVLEALEYTYDAAGNVVKRTDARLEQATTYAYNALNRLTEFNPPGEGATGYGYDAAGNRTEAGGTTYTFNDLNQLAEASDGTSYGYDGAGRLTSVVKGEEETTYEWDLFDHLAKVEGPTETASYAYDALERLSDRTTGSGTTAAHYGDLTDLPTYDASGEGETTTSYVQGANGLLEQRSGEVTTFPLADGHGNITAVVSAPGEVASRQSYDPWGSQLFGPTLEMGYLGAQQRRFDPTSGLMQMGARSYAPELGAFLSEDPVFGAIGIGISANRYPYAWDNPLFYFDLDGRFPSPGDLIGAAGDTIDNARDAVKFAQEYWVNSESPIAPVAGSLVSMVDLAINSDRLDYYLKSNDLASKDVLADCYRGGHPARQIGSYAGAVGGFGAGVASATDLGARSVGVGALSAKAGIALGGGIGTLGGCAVGIVDGYL